MARYLGPRLRLSRREGIDLMLTSAAGTAKSKKFEVAPGQHGAKKKRPSVYGSQLRAKQALKRMYGVLERQFRRYYFEAARRKGATGEVLLQLLEMRLDNIVFRAGFATTRAEARQLVTHKAIKLNGKIVNIPSCQVKVGDNIEVVETKREQTRIQLAVKTAKERPLAEWIGVDFDKLNATVKVIPARTDLPAELNENAVVELYSK